MCVVVIVLRVKVICGITVMLICADTTITQLNTRRIVGSGRGV